MLVLFSSYSGTTFILASLAYILVLLVSMTLHEWAHAYVAYRNGDYTPKAQGRLSLNPLVHIEPIGFLCSALFCFGWAKPVPINPLSFRNYKRGIALTSIAGVVVNLILAILSCGVYVAIATYTTVSNNMLFFLLMLAYTMFALNISLFVFNLLPIAPLDGYNFIAGISGYNNPFVQFMSRYGFLILFFILIIGNFAGGSILARLVNWISYPILKFWRWVL